MALGLGWLAIFAYAVHVALPFNPVHLPFEGQEFRRVVPEGWAFFTRNPREEAIFLFSRRSNGEWDSASLGPNGIASNAFGLNRISRAQGVETALLMNRFPNSAYRDCSGALTKCLDDTPSSRSLANESPNPSLCGDVGIVLRKPLPWAWFAAGMSTSMPARILRIKVGCP